MLTEGVSSYWESSASRPHYIELEIPDGFVWTDVMLFTHDFGDYSPEIVNVKVGDKMIKSSIKLSRGWSLYSIYYSFKYIYDIKKLFLCSR